MSAPVIDLVFLLVVLAFSVFGAINGFLNELFGKAAPALSIWVSVLFYGKLAAPLERNIKIHLAAVALSFLLIFIVSFIVIKLVQALLKNIFSGSVFKSLDRFLGFAIGIVEGLAVVALALIIMKAQPWFETDAILAGSRFEKALDPVVSIPLSGAGGGTSLREAIDNAFSPDGSSAEESEAGGEKSGLDEPGAQGAAPEEDTEDGEESASDGAGDGA